MNWIAAAIAFVGPALLPIAVAVLLEELTYGGMVRLLLVPRPGNRKQESPKPQIGGTKCSH
jgi:hypothetical protein